MKFLANSFTLVLLVLATACGSAEDSMTEDQWEHLGHVRSSYLAPDLAGLFSDLEAVQSAAGSAIDIDEDVSGRLILLINDIADGCGDPRYSNIIPTDLGLLIVGDIGDNSQCADVGAQGFTLFAIDPSLLPEPLPTTISIERTDSYGHDKVEVSVPDVDR